MSFHTRLDVLLGLIAQSDSLLMFQSYCLSYGCYLADFSNPAAVVQRTK